MTIDKNGWLSGANVWPGIADKVYTEPNSGKGIACHSVEGIDRTDHIPDRFLSTAKDPNGQYTPAAQASVMFVNPIEGKLIQMYPVTASTWTSGNRAANCSLWAVESEGFAGTPLNESQIANMLYLAHEWEARSGAKLTRGANGDHNCWQHNEVWNWSPQNAGPTACPSNRYDRFFAELEARAWEKDEAPMGMTPEERNLFIIAGGPFDNMVACYDRLAKAGCIDESDGKIAVGDPSVNAAELRRFRIIAAAATDAKKAFRALS